jgi:aspartyl protease family protein
VRVSVRIGNPLDRDLVEDVADALVDTVATPTTVPRSMADRLGLQVLDQHEVRTAGGVVTVDESFAYFEYDERKSVTPVWISDDYPDVLIGVITLESFGLKVDPRTGRLERTEFLLL